LTGSKASKDLLIYKSYNEDIKIRDFKSNDDVGYLIDALGKWRFSIGISHELSEAELKINIEHIFKNYGMLNLHDIESAKDMMITDDLNVDNRHFQEFSPMYISKALNAYKKYRGGIVAKINMNNYEYPEATDYQKLSLKKENIYVLYKKRNSVDFRDYKNIVYNLLDRHFLKITNDEKKEAILNARIRVKNYLLKEKSLFEKATSIKDKNQNDLRKDERNELINSFAKSGIVQNFLLKMDEKEIHVFLEKITPKMIKND